MENRFLSRGKRIDNGEWVKGNLIRLNDAEVGYEAIIIPTNDSNMYTKGGSRGDLGFENWHRVNETTICQCTELSDKTGEIIFKNDIVDFLGHRGIVKFECGSFGIAYKKHIDWDEIQANIMPLTGCENTLYACENDNYISLWEIYWNFNDEDDSLSTVEVIGNIFDNPELLEV